MSVNTDNTTNKENELRFVNWIKRNETDVFQAILVKRLRNDAGHKTDPNTKNHRLNS